MKIARIVFALICLLIFASHIVSMSRWSEVRGVYDDLCYLRQAHLFQRFGVDGLNTDVMRDDDHYFAGKLKEIAYAEWSDRERWPCHNQMPSGKFVIQYPPGTGFLLALFPDGSQVAPLYIAASLIVCSFALLAILMAKTVASVVGAGMFGALVMCLMINPAKASYSIAPTMAVCAVAGFLTARWLRDEKRSVLLIALIGLVLGASVALRVPNALLVGGYALFLGISFLWSRTSAAFVQGLAFSGGVLVGLAPTLMAQAINAGSPFATTYGSVDAVAPAIDVTVLGQYLRDMQFVLIVLAIGSAAWLLGAGGDGVRRVGLVVAANLAVNLVYFLSHPIFTPYYIVPIAMLSLWSAAFAWLMRPEEAGQGATVRGELASAGALAK